MSATTSTTLDFPGPLPSALPVAVWGGLWLRDRRLRNVFASLQ